MAQVIRHEDLRCDHDLASLIGEEIADIHFSGYNEVKLLTNKGRIVRFVANPEARGIPALSVTEHILEHVKDGWRTR